MKASGPPHVLKLRLVVSKGMLPVKYFCTNRAFFMSVEFHGDHKTVIKLRRIWPPSVLGILPDLKPWRLSFSQSRLLSSPRCLPFCLQYCCSYEYLAMTLVTPHTQQCTFPLLLSSLQVFSLWNQVIDPVLNPRTAGKGDFTSLFYFQTNANQG